MKLRCSVIAAIAMGIMVNAGLSFAQDAQASLMPEKVRTFLANLVGTWVAEEDGQTYTFNWESGNSVLVAEDQTRDNSHTFSEIWYWDGVSEDGIRQNWSGLTDKGFAYGEARWKVVSKTLLEGTTQGVVSGKEFTSDLRFEVRNSDQFTMNAENLVAGGEKQPDRQLMLMTRIKPTTHEDFEEFCRLYEGAWVVRVPLSSDVPGVGTKGEVVSVHLDYTIIEEGAGLLVKAYSPGGTNTWLHAYDEKNQQIVSTGVSPLFAMDSVTIHYKNRTWTCRDREMNPDGTEYERTITGTFSADGRTETVTITVAGPNGEKTTTDVSHRVNPKSSK